MIIIDRFEEAFAVLETDSGMLNIERSELPAYAREGDVLEFDGKSYSVNAAETELRRTALRNRAMRLMNRND